MTARPIQIRWNGIVSPPGSTYIRLRLMTALTIQAPISSRSVRNQPVANIAHGLHSVGVVEFRAQAADTDVDDIAARIEGQAPHIGEDLGPGAGLAGALNQVLQQQELT